MISKVWFYNLCLSLFKPSSFGLYRPGQPNWEFWMLIFQYGNLAIFLPLWFYVKSLLADFRRSKTTNATILRLLILIFFGISRFKMSNISKSAKLRPVHMVKMSVFWAYKWPNLIWRKISEAEKSWNFQIVFSKLGCPWCTLHHILTIRIFE